MERRETHIELVDKMSDIKVTIAEGFAEARAHFQATAKEIAEIKKEQEKTVHTLFGNGKEGIVTTVAKMSSKLSLMWIILMALTGAVLTSLTGIDIAAFIP